ncbi:hypothetical protein [Cellulomonas sp. KRMCY2]|uniref:hypothetical protein n=1 Tax=Cellulomonas sp. KRMCY2 TaxID=1304865 RepID=UPI00045E9602|nr:hypothetical protein [Cellulomonas sp. KRMCY2]
MITADLQFDHGRVRLDFDDVHLIRGIGVHALSLSYRSSADWLPMADGTRTQAAMLTGYVRAGATVAWLGAIAPTAVVLRERGGTGSVLVTLSEEQIDALGREPGRDVELRFTLQLSLVRPPPGVHPVAETEVGYRIPAHRWSAMLDELGTALAIYLRVPAPLGARATTDLGEAPSLTRATTRLREAHDRARDQQWAGAVSTCRSALEELRRLIDLPAESRTHETKPRNRAEDERWAALYYAVKGLADAASHNDAITSEFRWSRAGADAVIASTGALLAHYSDPTVAVGPRGGSPAADTSTAGGATS